MSDFAIAVLVGLVAAVAGWIVFVPLSTPRLKWSAMVAVRYMSTSPEFQVKLVNRRPWSARDVDVSCLLVASGSASDRVVVNVPLRETCIPVIGGWAFRKRRIRKFGWLGASHRILSIQFHEISKGDLQRLNANAQGWLRSPYKGSLDGLFGGDGELVVVAVARDSIFFGRTGVSMQLYRPGAAVVGAFRRGRSMAVTQTQSRLASSSSSKISIDDKFLVDVGLGELPSELRPQMQQYLYARLEMSVGRELADQMTDDQLDEFEQYIDAEDDAGAYAWLERNIPDYRSVVNRKLEELRTVVRGSAGDILRAEGVERVHSIADGAAAVRSITASSHGGATGSDGT